MVSISSQEVEIYVSEIEWYNQEYSAALPNNFESTVRIVIKGSVCFEEPVSIGELILQLREWDKTILNNQMEPFNFNSLDTEDNPIISINQGSNQAGWVLFTNPCSCQPQPLTATNAISLLRSLRAALEQEFSEKFGDIVIAW